jgi:hypothetical protein
MLQSVIGQMGKTQIDMATDYVPDERDERDERLATREPPLYLKRLKLSINFPYRIFSPPSEYHLNLSHMVVDYIGGIPSFSISSANIDPNQRLYRSTDRSPIFVSPFVRDTINSTGTSHMVPQYFDGSIAPIWNTGNKFVADIVPSDEREVLRVIRYYGNILINHNRFNSLAWTGDKFLMMSCSLSVIERNPFFLFNHYYETIETPDGTTKPIPPRKYDLDELEFYGRNALFIKSVSQVLRVYGGFFLYQYERIGKGGIFKTTITHTSPYAAFLTDKFEVEINQEITGFGHSVVVKKIEGVYEPVSEGHTVTPTF